LSACLAAVTVNIPVTLYNIVNYVTYLLTNDFQMADIKPESL